jgi:hypothetical protein
MKLYCDWLHAHIGGVGRVFESRRVSTDTLRLSKQRPPCHCRLSGPRFAARAGLKYQTFATWRRWPYWLYFCNLDIENLMMMEMCCLDSLDALKVQGRDQVQVSLEPLEILRFISGGFVPINEMCERAGMIERQIFDRTKALFEYFNLPIDAGI